MAKQGQTIYFKVGLAFVDSKVERADRKRVSPGHSLTSIPEFVEQISNDVSKSSSSPVLISKRSDHASLCRSYKLNGIGPVSGGIAILAGLRSQTLDN